MQGMWKISNNTANERRDKRRREIKDVSCRKCRRDLTTKILLKIREKLEK